MGTEFDNVFLIKFGENLRKIRESTGQSQRALATLCTIDHSDISKIEKGERNITILTVLELATTLSVKPKKLLDFEY
jgi:transcriptional regulator with XRE-family HTH domain